MLIGSLVWPVSVAFQIGTLNMQIYKFALVFLVPLILMEMLRNPVRLRAPDYLILLFGAMQALITVYHHGLTETFFVYSYVLPISSVGWENIGITGLEYLVPYFTARVFVRSREDLAAVIKVLMWLAIGISVFAWIEAITAFSLFRGESIASQGQRLGLYRAAGPFPGPIQWGFFASSLVAFMVSQAMGPGRFKFGHLVATILVLGAVFTSLSSAAYMAVAIQIGLTAYLLMSIRLDRRWLLFAVGAMLLYVFIDLLSNRTPVHVFFSYATLNPWTGYYRLLVWDFGWQNFLTSPLVGIGFNDWFRAHWMTASIDAYWLVLLMRYGILGTLPLVLATLAALRIVGRSIEREPTEFPIGIAIAWSFSVISAIVVGFTVHYFGHALLVMMFLFGLWGSVQYPLQQKYGSQYHIGHGGGSIKSNA
eukprot:s1_g810.t1